MALQLSFSKFGQTFATSYSRIRTSFGQRLSAGGGSQQIQIDMYKDEAVRDAEAEPIASFNYQVGSTAFTTYFEITPLNVVNQNPYERAYAYLKQLDPTTIQFGGSGYPDYRNATDV